MIRTFSSVLLVFCFLISRGQSFEGELTYKVEFDIKAQKIGKFEITKEQVINKMKSEGEYFDQIVITIKDGNYEKKDNSDFQKRIVYKADENKIFTFQKDFEYVTITDASKANPMELDIPKPSFEMIDTTKVIYGKECLLLKVSWEHIGTEWYYYDSSFLSLNSSLFKNHHYEYLNEVLRLTNSYPTEIVKTLNDMITVRMTLVNVSEKEVDDSHFTLPEMTNAEEEHADMIKKLTGCEVKKSKN